MKTALDPEWRDLMEDWQAEEPASPPALSAAVRSRIRRKAKRHGYGLIALAAGEVLGCLATLAFFFREVSDDPSPVQIVGFAGTVFFFAVALVFVFWNRRGTWWTATETTRDFVEISYLRCQRKLRTLRFCPWLLAAELLFLIPWAVWALLSKPEPASPGVWLSAFGWVVLAVAAVLAWSSWYGRRVRRELAELTELRRSLGEEG